MSSSEGKEAQDQLNPREDGNKGGKVEPHNVEEEEAQKAEPPRKAYPRQLDKDEEG